MSRNIIINNVEKMSVIALRGNIVRLHCKEQPVNVVYGDDCSEHWELQETLISSDEKIGSSKSLKTEIILNYIKISTSLHQ